jgi:hypothetical protein
MAILVEDPLISIVAAEVRETHPDHEETQLLVRQDLMAEDLLDEVLIIWSRLNTQGILTEVADHEEVHPRHVDLVDAAINQRFTHVDVVCSVILALDEVWSLPPQLELARTGETEEHKTAWSIPTLHCLAPHGSLEVLRVDLPVALADVHHHVDELCCSALTKRKRIQIRC